MYDITQLNDMLVPELQDIAIEQNISNAKKLEKQELISQILDKQSTMNNGTEGEKPKRKRMPKAVAESNGTGESGTEEKIKPEPKARRSEASVWKKSARLKKKKKNR